MFCQPAGVAGDVPADAMHHQHLELPIGPTRLVLALLLAHQRRQPGRCRSLDVAGAGILLLLFQNRFCHPFAELSAGRQQAHECQQWNSLKGMHRKPPYAVAGCVAGPHCAEPPQSITATAFWSCISFRRPAHTVLAERSVNGGDADEIDRPALAHRHNPIESAISFFPNCPSRVTCWRTAPPSRPPAAGGIANVTRKGGPWAAPSALLGVMRTEPAGGIFGRGWPRAEVRTELKTSQGR